MGEIFVEVDSSLVFPSGRRIASIVFPWGKKGTDHNKLLINIGKNPLEESEKGLA